MLVLSRHRNETIVIDPWTSLREKLHAITQDESLSHVELLRAVHDVVIDLIQRDPISVVTVDIRGDKVRFGISAPKDTPVHRLEVHEAIQRKGKRLPTPVFPVSPIVPSTPAPA